ncbi:FadR/GntR family transcriptional regulator [Fodinicola feengrottensis]|uniref:FadR/GntR family transcriptional regulator n=1 Tax=Fodinicola feengrottensis TaxID=435914 RepID=UPI0013CF435F|nr:FadR/GntR family transcriptional regulator [Fodinicola feengrottensis]
MPAQFQTVQPVRAYQRVVEQVEEAVLTGALKPGERLPSERELMAQFGVSRSTVREALRVLESGGMVRSPPGDPHGPLVLPYSPAGLEKSMSRLAHLDQLSLAELLQFRMMVEGGAYLLAARLRTDAQLAEMRGALDAMERAVDRGPTAFSEADLAFHDTVARMSGNMLIIICSQVVHGVVLDMIAGKLQKAPDPRAVMAETLDHHQQALAAVRAGNGQLAADLARAKLYEYYADHLSSEERTALKWLVDGR